eukprot:TRINITY_DN4120_c0_g1_i1.p1 TRINITY_DN4120_c0_g1~~TRINITY_DN4120_c0_g1_i1.p1  ORF type:complete len:1054 (-),score=265.94 TRINITY_DN4120_c0_g1_i1:42-3203(-)
MERILENPLDVQLLDQVVNVVYTSVNDQERAYATAVLDRFKEHPDSWTKADTILETSSVLNTKFYALLVLNEAIKVRWNALPVVQREGIKNYIIQLIYKLSYDDQTLHQQRVFVQKLDQTLVAIIKQEWPHNWPSFVSDMVTTARTSETVCENTMVVLRLLSEEIFDFSQGEMTSQKTKELKASFNQEFSLIYQLCEFVLENGTKPALINATLETLLRFLNWIPLGFIFETKMLDWLLYKYFSVDSFRNVALKCLCEISSLECDAAYDPHFVKIYHLLLQQLRVFLSADTDIGRVYDKANDAMQRFISNLSLFFGSFFKHHLRLIEAPEHQPVNLEGQKYLVQIALVDDVEVFKVCLEYFNYLASDLYHEAPQQQPILMLSQQRVISPRRALYAPVLSRVRLVLVSRMPRPEEVLIAEEDGEIVHVTMKDTDAINLYKHMRETLIYLTHLDYEDTQSIMLEKLAAQVEDREWSWHNLNTLCWAIGSISGALPEEDEKRFLVTVIRELLGLVDMKRGKDNKAVIASNIMYVVGQYPRFLSAHWKFLKTVVNKLFEFMHETHPGVQDMACDTFLKISQKCRRKFVTLQIGEQVPFIDELLGTLPQIISELQAHQIQAFYEAVGYMVQAQPDQHLRETLLARLMHLPNSTWTGIMAMAAQNVELLKQGTVCKDLSNILKTNTRVCVALGHPFVTQLGRIYLDMLNVFKAYSQMMQAAVASGQPMVLQTQYVRSLRSVKREALKLVNTFIEKAVDVGVIATSFLPPLSEAVLSDYKSAVPDARDVEVLTLYVTVATKLRQNLTPEVPRILDGLFEVTLAMITKNFEDFPEHRVAFFNLLRQINIYCFPALLSLSAAQFKLFLDSVIWAIKHTDRTISETGLYTLSELLKNVQQSEFANPFHQTYFLSILQDLFVALTDTFHMAGFKLQALLLQYMFGLVESGAITAPLWDPSQVQASSNQQFLRDFFMNLLASAFANLSPQYVQGFVLGLFDQGKDAAAFKTHLRDFLVQMKQFGGENLFEEEKALMLEQTKQLDQQRLMAVPGLMGPAQAVDDGMS